MRNNFKDICDSSQPSSIWDHLVFPTLITTSNINYNEIKYEKKTKNNDNKISKGEGFEEKDIHAVETLVA